MSPFPLLKVSEAERVHDPFTLSETCTCPDAANWPNQPTSRSPAFTGLDRVSVSEVGCDPGESAIPCTNAGELAGVWTWAAFPAHLQNTRTSRTRQSGRPCPHCVIVFRSAIRAPHFLTRWPATGGHSR